MSDRGFTVWFTGLSGSGKSTIALRVAELLRARRSRVELLSGSEFRRNVSHGLGFSREDRISNVRRIGYVARLLTRNGVAVVTTSISPYRETRDECRRMIGAFVEVWVDCPSAVCEQRDRKGLWARARAGEILDFTGVTEAYEPPTAPEVVCHSAEESPDRSAARVIEWLERAGWIAPSGEPAPRETEMVKARLRELGEA
jgi:adenylyl-sulfate kinase